MPPSWDLRKIMRMPPEGGATSRFAAESARGFKNLLFAGHGGVFERRREGNRHVHGADSLHRPVEVVEGAFRNHPRDFRGDSVGMVSIDDNNAPPSLLAG